MDGPPELLPTHDDDFQPRSNGPAAQSAAESQPVLVNPQHITTEASDDMRRLTRLLWIFAVLLAALVTPTVIGKLQYAFSYNRERARVDASLEALERLDLSDLSQAFRHVAQGVRPSVVHIKTARNLETHGFHDERRHLFGNPEPLATLGQGAGVIVDKEGYIVTNNHVIEHAESITVQFSDGRESFAKVVGVDPLTDIAVLKVDLDDLIAQGWGDSETLEVGSMVWAVGSPFGLQRSITFGIVSAKNRRGVTRSLIQDFLQTDVAVNPGNSGGPLVNIDGKIVGINTAIVGQSYQGISFAIPSNRARNIYEQIRKKGKISRGWLGVALGEVNVETVRKFQLNTTKGVLVLRILNDSPAYAAGLQHGDLILAWNGVEVDDPPTLSFLIADTPIGSEATVRIIRGGKTLDLSVKVAERPRNIG